MNSAMVPDVKVRLKMTLNQEAVVCREKIKTSCGNCKQALKQHAEGVITPNELANVLELAALQIREQTAIFGGMAVGWL